MPAQETQNSLYERNELNGARLIKELDTKLKQIETEVRDAFKELDEKETHNWRRNSWL
jgi:hypothetical protein